MSLARPAFRILLAALLVFSQQQAVLHLAAHGLERLVQKKEVPDPKELVCAKCLALAHLDHSVSGAALAFDRPSFAPVRFDPVARPQLHLVVLPAYRSRAPPVFS